MLALVDSLCLVLFIWVLFMYWGNSPFKVSWMSSYLFIFIVKSLSYLSVGHNVWPWTAGGEELFLHYLSTLNFVEAPNPQISFAESKTYIVLWGLSLAWISSLHVKFEVVIFVDSSPTSLFSVWCTQTLLQLTISSSGVPTMIIISVTSLTMPLLPSSWSATNLSETGVQ